jgi:glycosyltransferase involved in cell wall biosynthesis
MTHIFIVCYNESVLLPHTIAHYRRTIPYANITILDNESTDGSQDIAHQLGCQIIPWSSQDRMDFYLYNNLKNQCWKHVNGWVIVVDMDEWLCITDQELEHELQNGTTLLSTRVVDMVAESKNEHLTDIHLHTLNRCVEKQNKMVCFYRNGINEINFNMDYCYPVGRIQYSFRNYTIKHMSFLGLPFYTKKILDRYNRTNGQCAQYTDNINTITNEYNQHLINSNILN